MCHDVTLYINSKYSALRSIVFFSSNACFKWPTCSHNYLKKINREYNSTGHKYCNISTGVLVDFNVIHYTQIIWEEVAFIWKVTGKAVAIFMTGTVTRGGCTCIIKLS